MGTQYRILLGYRLCDGIIVPDEKMGPVIQMIFHDYAKGSFIGHICARLESLGLENSRGNVKWQARKIRDILKEEAYCGNSIYPALISRELYDQVQEQCIIRNNHKRYKTDEDVKEKNKFVYSKMLKCTDCGSLYKRISRGRVQRADGSVNPNAYWFCPCCKVEREKKSQVYVRVTDEQIRQVYKEMINQMLVSPAVFHDTAHVSQNLTNTITEELEKKVQEINFKEETAVAEATNLYFKLAQERFSLLRLDQTEEKTGSIEKSLSHLEHPVTDFNKEVFKKVVKEIRINQKKEMQVELTNGLEMPFYL